MLAGRGRTGLRPIGPNPAGRSSDGDSLPGRGPNGA